MQDEGKLFSEQEDCARRAIAEDPNFARGQLALASIIASQGNFNAAQEAVRTALNIDRDLPDAHVILGSVFLFQGKTAEARKELLVVCQL
jgi:Tfp pilus assembly protein PilF